MHMCACMHVHLTYQTQIHVRFFTTTAFYSVASNKCEPDLTQACNQDCDQLLGGTGGGKCGPANDAGIADTCVCDTGYTMVDVNLEAKICRKN